MSGVTDERQLPEEVAGQLRELARARTAGTTPWPRMHVAVRRSRQRRRIAGVAVLTAVLAVAGTLAGGALRPDREPVPADRGTKQVPARPADPDPLNLGGATAGSLGDDTAWLDGLKQGLVRHELAPDVAHVRVLWATDHAGSRHAVTITQPSAQTYRLAHWRGAAGATPEQMSLGDVPLELLDQALRGMGTGLPLEGGLVPPEVFQIRDGTGTSGPGLLVAVGSNLAMVDAASGFDYDGAGRKTATWTPLTPDAAVWWRAASDGELDAMKVRAVMPDGKRVPVTGSIVYGDIEVPPIGLQEVAAPGTNPKVLACAAMAFWPEQGGFPAGSTPLLGAAPKVGPDWIGLAVARAPGGGYLVGLCRTQNTAAGSSSGAEQAGGYVLPAPAGGFDDLFAVLPGRLTPDEIAAAYVIAPVGATEVEVAGATAPVRDRLAVVTLPRGTIDAGLRAEARDAAGNVLASTGLARYETLTELGSFFDVRPFAPYAGDEPPE